MRNRISRYADIWNAEDAVESGQMDTLHRMASLAAGFALAPYLPPMGLPAQFSAAQQQLYQLAWEQARAAKQARDNSAG